MCASYRAGSVHLECNERLLRQQQDLAATETERRTLQTQVCGLFFCCDSRLHHHSGCQLEGAQHELAETRRAATDAVAREGARGHHALDQVASNAQAAETRVAALHARLDEALGYRVLGEFLHGLSGNRTLNLVYFLRSLREQHIKKIAHLEQAFEGTVFVDENWNDVTLVFFALRSSASQAALKRQRVAAEGHRRVVSTFASKQLNELVAEV